MSNTKTRIWLRSLLGVALILAVPAILTFALRSAYQTSREPGGVDRSVFDYALPKDAAKPAGTAGTASTPTPAPEREVTRVYECRKDGKVVYSGQPCESGSATHAADARGMNADTSPAYEVPTSPAPTVSKPVLREQATAAAEDNSPAATLRRAGECSAVQEEIAQINVRMRKAYSAADGRFLGERLRKLNAKLSESKCAR